ncbi:MAG: ABC transporter substrate-binding protein [Acetatifactor sp.]
MKKWISILMAVALTAGLLTGCGDSANVEESSQSTTGSTVVESPTYTLNVAESYNTVTWNQHEVEVTESITQYTELPLWDLVMNDTADGYMWVCEMAACEPEDITPEYAGDEKWGIPADASEGYAWKVTLNPDAKWEDGTPINADSYIYSMRQLLNPEMKNYNVSGFYTELPIYNAENYCKAGQTTKELVADVSTYEMDDYGDAPLYISFTQPTSAFWGYAGADYYPGYEAYYVNEAGEDLMVKYGSQDYVPVTDEVIADINYMLMNFWGNTEIAEDDYLYMAFYDKTLKAVSFDEVGFFKTGDYELTVILYSPQTPYFFKYNSSNFALVNEEKYEAGKTQTGDMIKTNYGTSVDTYMSYGPYKLVSFQADKEYRLTRNENWYGWTDGKHEGLYQTTDIVCSNIQDTTTSEQLFLQGKLDMLGLNAETLDKYQGSDYLAYAESDSIWFLNINNDWDALTAREEPGINKTILTYTDFRKGISLSFNRAEFVAQKGYGKVLYGYISDYYIYDVDNAYRYRDSEPAQETLKTFYGVNDVKQITGYDLDVARESLVAGYEQALADGVVSETDKFAFDYPVYDTSENSNREVIFLQNALDAATKGTALEGRITINMVVSEDYYSVLDSGEYDICSSGWNGTASNPYGRLACFVSDEYSPQALLGFDPYTETLPIVLNGTEETHTYYEWYELLCKGDYAIADAETKNQILASVELALLSKYRDCPIWSSSAAYLLSQKIAYPTYESVLEVGFGGIRCMTYNYTDAEWAAYCAENNNRLNYQ